MTALRRLAALVAAVGLPAAAPCRNYLNYGDCFHYTAIDATFHCSEFFCPGCPYSGHCDELCGFCGEYGSLLRDCRGVEAPSVFIGDGFCDDGTYLYDGKTVDFDCPAFGCDGGDCPSALECGTDAPTPSGPRERDVYAATIEEIQRRATLDFEDDDGDDASIVFDCSRSVLSHRVVRVSGVVSAVAGTGFYFQDGVGPWNGLFAHAGSTAAVLSSLRVGDVVDVVGYVDEHLGQTQVEVAGDDAFGVAVVGRTAPYAAVDVATATLGAYRRRERDDVDGARCPDAGEPYEGVLVRVSDVALSGSADAFGRVAADDGSGGTLLYEVEAPDDRPSLLDKQRRRGRRVDVATVVAVGVLAVSAGLLLGALVALRRVLCACPSKPVGARVDPGMALPQHQIEIPVAQARVVPDAAEAPDDGVPLADARPRRRDPSQMTFRIRLRDGPRPPAPAPRAVSEGAAPPPPDRSAPPEATAVFDDPATVAEPVPVDGFAYVPAPRPRRDSDDSRSSDEPYAEDRLPRPHPRGRQTYIIRGLRRPPRSPRPDEAPAPESSEAARHAPPPALAGPPPRSPEPEEPAEEAKDESGGPRPRAPAFASADEEKADEEVVFKSGRDSPARLAPDAEEAEESGARPD